MEEKTLNKVKINKMYLKRGAFLIAILLSLSLAIISGSRFPYLITFMLTIMFFGMAVIIFSNKKNLYHFFYLSKESIEVGQELALEFKVTNTGLIPVSRARVRCLVSKKLGDMTFPDEVIFLNSFQLVNLKKNIVCKHRGFYRVGSIEVEVMDPFGLFKKEITFDKDIDLTVFPKVHEIGYMKIPATEFFGTVEVNHSSHEDFSSLKKVRKYNIGDSVKRIHWKLSSKYNELYIKEYELTASTKVTMFVDGFSGSYIGDENQIVEERLVEVAASVLNYSLRNKLETNLIYSTSQRTKIEGRDAGKLEDFLKGLIAFAPEGSVALDELLTVESKKLASSSTVVLVTPKVTEELFNSIIGLQRRQFKVLLLLIDGIEKVNDEDRDTRVEILKTEGVSVRIVLEDAEIKETLEEYN